jgi:hypothetical protein
MNIANMSTAQLEEYLVQSKAELKQARSERRSRRKAASPVTSSDWSKHHDENSGITYHVHGPSGGKVFNNLTGSHKWEIRGTSSNGQIYTTLQEAKNHIETEHAEGQK